LGIHVEVETDWKGWASCYKQFISVLLDLLLIQLFLVCWLIFVSGLCTWPPLWSSGQSFWLLTQGSRVRFAALPDSFWAAVGLEGGPLSLVNNLRSYLEEIVAAPGLENRSYDLRDSLRWWRDTLYPLKLALASYTGVHRSVGIVR
jgi:hypothetical protein